MYKDDIRRKAVLLRLQGKSYEAIRERLGADIPASTLSYWMKGLDFPAKLKASMDLRREKNLAAGRAKARDMKKLRKTERERRAESKGKILGNFLRVHLGAQKIALAMLYLAEGSKTERGSLMFGNSNPAIVRLFLFLLESCYGPLQKDKMRITVQCRADQDTNKLERFWSEVTRVPLKNFYGTRVDARSVGKKTLKRDYKGVCRIDYFSADIDFELRYLGVRIEKTLRF